MTLSEELTWRGFVHQSTYDDITHIDNAPITFYWGVDPSAPSMTVGNFAIAMMIRHFIKHGHKPILLVGGATVMIGDPDGKAEERQLLSDEEIAVNKQAIADQYGHIFDGQEFTLVDNYEWFKGIDYLTFLREVGKHVPMRQMLGRDFVQARLKEGGAGISYAEFSYALIQGYDYLYLHENHGATLQVCGSDQWGNSIAGVDLIRRKTGKEAHVWSAPLVVNKATGKKFGKSEEGAVWLDAQKTTPTQFYQFWLNVDDEGVGDYLKIYTELEREEIEAIIGEHQSAPQKRYAQLRLAHEVTRIVHGSETRDLAEDVTYYITGRQDIGHASETQLSVIRKELYSTKINKGTNIIDALKESGLTASNSEGRRLLQTGSIYVNGQSTSEEAFQPEDFKNNRLLLRKGKTLKNTALIELDA